MVVTHDQNHDESWVPTDVPSPRDNLILVLASAVWEERDLSTTPIMTNPGTHVRPCGKADRSVQPTTSRNAIMA